MTPNERYGRLIDSLQDVARQLITFGLHVHVGVDSGDKAVMITDRIMRHLPTLLALSANSPWWNGRDTGLHSFRSKVMEMLPTAGLPAPMRNWSEYVWLVNHLVDTGFITSIRDIWWDVRPHHNFGTVEVRVCDMPGSLDIVLGLAALVQCLVYRLSEEIDRGTYLPDHHPMMVRQNKWRAARYGLDAPLVDSNTYKSHSARDVACHLVDLLHDTATTLDCLPYLELIRRIAQEPTGAERQRQTRQQSTDLPATVRQLVSRSRL